MAYDYSQSFKVDSAVVKGATEVDIHSVELFFKCKPKKGTPSESNRSNTLEPGVFVGICPTNIDGTPILSQIIDHARLEYNEIPISGDGSSPAIFKFENILYMQTDKEYAIVVMPDSSEDYVPWTNKKGDFIVGTATPSPGATDKLVGNLFKTQERVPARPDPYEPGSPGQSVGTVGPANPQWVPLTNEDLKFRINVCNYGTGSGTGGGGNTIQYTLTSTHEYILYDRKLSKKESKPRKGEYIFQNTSFHTGTVSIQKGNLTIVGTGVDFETLYPQTANNDSYIVIITESTANAYANNQNSNFTINVRKIASVEANNTILVDRIPTFSNTTAKFLLPTAVAQMQINDRTRSFGRDITPSWYFADRNKQDFMILYNSNANSSIRFVNNTIEQITVTNAGSGYNNSDYIVIASSTTGSVNAVANLTTNSTGSITSTYITNTGCGMIAQPVASVYAANGATSNGTSAAFSFKEGPTLRSEIEKFYLKDVEVINWDVHATAPIIELTSSSGTTHNIYVQYGYYRDSSNTYNILQGTSANKSLMKNLEKNNFNYKDTPVLISRSNEAKLANNSNYILANGTVVTSTAGTLVEVGSNTTNDFIPKCIKNSGIITYNYIINNDYTDENTPFGNAMCKHVSSRVPISEGKLAEDILVYVRAFRPVGTDVKVFARLYNSKDIEAFDDKDWTLLECIEGANKYSSSTDTNDVYEYTFNLSAYPNTLFTSAGTITSNLNNATITGIGTDFLNEVGGFASGDLVKIYPSLFPENYQVAVVNTVTNSTSLILDDIVSNSSIVGTGLNIDKLAYKNQAFNNSLNGNVSRYYNTAMQGFDGYDTYAIKLVLLAEDPKVYPQIEDIRTIAVSA